MGEMCRYGLGQAPRRCVRAVMSLTYLRDGGATGGSGSRCPALQP